MIRCITCLYPTSKPDLHFADGECSACRSYKNRPEIDWDSRKKELEQLLDRFHGEVLVPSSGGKDSTYQCIALKNMGAHVTAVTARTCHLTPIGRRNIDNLARHVRTIEYTPDMTVRANLNRLGLEMVGDISWPEHVAIFSAPFRAAVDLKKPLIMYGENPQNQYGGPQGTHETKRLTEQWRAEFGGFLGLRPSDLIGLKGITRTDMADYDLPRSSLLHTQGIEGHFLGQYLPWDSHHNAQVAREHGMEQQLPTPANWWDFENVDNAQTGLHDYMMWRKFGYGRATAQLSVDIRAGLVERDYALSYIKEHEHIFPETYAGVPIGEVLENIKMTREDLYKIMDQFTNWELFRRVVDDHAAMPIKIGK